MDQAKRGAALLEANNPLEAVSAYTKALIEHPTSPDYFIQRSTAFTRLSPPRHGPALQDAEKAVLYGHQRSKRASIQAAQHRRVVSLYNLGRYADAKHLLETMRPWVDKEDKKGNMQIDMWMSKANNKLKTATDEQKAVSVEEKPSIELPSEKQRANILRRQIKPDGSYNFDWENEEVTATPAVTATESATSQPANSTSNTSAKAPTTTSKIRHEWYQNAQSVIVTLYAKGVSKDKAEVDIQDDSITVSFPHPSDPTSEFSFSLDPLFAFVDPAASTYRVLSTKVEITLKKATTGQKWPALEGTEPLKKSTNGSESTAKAAVMSTLQQPAAPAPSYPTSSKTGPKNWDKLAADFTKKKKANDDNEDSDDDMKVDSDEEGGDQVDSFFKKLYKGSDPDTRRAMMKSFQESNGTALSTNWEEVGKKRVEVVESKDD